MGDDNLFLAAFSAAIGLAVAIGAWVLSRAAAAVPAEDREFRDPPPLAFRLLWPPIHWLGYYLDDKLPAKLEASLLISLRKGGLDYALRPSQFVAGRIVYAVACFLLAWWLATSLDHAKPDPQPFSDSFYAWTILLGTLFGWFYPALWLRDAVQARRRELVKTLPFFLDIITLCVEAGLNLHGAMHQSVLKGPKGVMRDEFQRVLRDIRAGKARSEALRALDERLNEAPLTNFVSAVIQAERVGLNLGPVLRAQADQQRVERFMRAEKLAMEAPVKMLFPLIAFIFPCTFIVLFFPIVIKFMESGI